MNKRDMALLEKAFMAEIDAALNGTPRPMQTKSARAEALVSEGLLERLEEVWRGVRIKGYGLTHAGRFAYCASA